MGKQDYFPSSVTYRQCDLRQVQSPRDLLPAEPRWAQALKDQNLRDCPEGPGHRGQSWGPQASAPFPHPLFGHRRMKLLPCWVWKKRGRKHLEKHLVNILFLDAIVKKIIYFLIGFIF